MTIVQDVLLKNDNFKYAIAGDGKNLSFIDKATGADYLNSSEVSYCAYTTRDGKDYPVSSASLKGNMLKLEFKNAGVTAEIHIKKIERQSHFRSD